MFKNIIKKLNKIPSYFYRNYAAPRIYSIRDRKILSKNLELKNKYSSQRCFVIGAGPSIATTDLSKLSQEHTFVVNEFEQNPQYKSLAPKFHILTDANYFTKGAPEYWLKRFDEKDKHISTNTAVIMGIGAKPVIDKRDMFKQHNIYYVGAQGIFTNNVPFNINLDRYVPNPKNSVLMCIVAAAWMDFNEIYLLGCEHSFLAQPLGRNKSLSYSHSHDNGLSKLGDLDTETLKKYITPKEMNFTYEANMESMLQLFRSYRLFYAKALKEHPNLKIFNATPNSFLDVFPMINFEDIKNL